MRKLLKSSYRKRLTLSFLIVSLAPLLLCSAMLFEVFRLQLSEITEREANEQLMGVEKSLSTVAKDFNDISSNLTKGRALIREMTKEDKKDTLIYKELFRLTAKMRDTARFDIYDADGRWKYSTKNYTPSEDMSTSWGIISACRKNPEGPVFMAQDNYLQKDKPLLQGACLMNDKDGNIIGYLIMSMDDYGLNELLEGKHSTSNELIILNKYWRPVFSTAGEMDEAKLDHMRRLILAGESVSSVDENFSYTVVYNSPLGLYLLLKHPEAVTISTLRLLYTVSLFTGLFCIVISVFMSIKLSRRNSKPVEELHKAMTEVGNNNLEVKASINYDDELGQLADKFNAMVSALKVNQEQMVENQKELNEAQIRMLQAQLNPHFLCNTLDTMKWISKINNVPQIALMSTNLADILRFCISPQEFVFLEKEIEILERYIEIQKIRLSDDFNLDIDIPEELYCALVPKMVLQPLVENAIMHGLEGVENGEIRVKACVKNEKTLEIIVEDNGIGLPDDMVGTYCHKDKNKLKGHLGLYNVDTILVKYYGEGYGLYLENIENKKGARVTATLPLISEEAENA